MQDTETIIVWIIIIEGKIPTEKEVAFPTFDLVPQVR